VLWRQELSKATRLRGALTHSVVRTSFGQLAPGVLVDGDTAELGNPELKPLRSRNLDFGVEHDWGREGGVSAYLFHKQINDFAFQTDLAGTTGKWKDFSSVNTFANGDTASVQPGAGLQPGPARPAWRAGRADPGCQCHLGALGRHHQRL
jgi:outer membrane receptor protein involved in Fe transport